MQKKKQMKLKYMIETLILLIHKQKKTQTFSKYFYSIMIFVQNIQVLSFIMTIHPKSKRVMYDPFLIYFNDFFYLFTSRSTMRFVGNDNVVFTSLTLLIMIQSYFLVYIYIVSVLRRKYQINLDSKPNQIVIISDKIMYILMNIYMWILFIPAYEIYFGVLFCNDKSMISYNRNNCQDNPSLLLFQILAYLGIFLSYIITLTINYYQVNYDFQDQNILTRKHKLNLLLQNLCKIFIIFLYFADIGASSNNIIKYIFSNIYGFLLSADFLLNLPYRDKQICHFYGILSLNILYVSGVFMFWEAINVLEEYNIFYLCILAQPVIAFSTYIIIKNYYDMMFIYSVNEMISKHWEVIDVFMEEIFTLAENSEKDHKAKIKLIAFIKNHLNTCTDADCAIKKGTIFDNYLENNNINMRIIVKILQVMFVRFFNRNTQKKSSHSKDLLILKYCSFLIQQQENLVKAYYEMKRIGKIQVRQIREQNNQKLNNAFKILFNQYCIHQEGQLDIAYEVQKNAYNFNQEKKIVAYCKTISMFDLIKKKIIKVIIDIAHMKQKYWEKLVDGYNKIDELKENCLELSRKINIFIHQFNEFISCYSEQLNEKENLIILKIRSILGSLVLNDYQYCYLSESKLEELKKKEKIFLRETINSISIIQGQSIVLTASLLNTYGNLKNKLNIKHGKFFNYQENEIQNINKIETFMPQVQANNHKFFIQNFLRKVHSSNIRINRRQFALDKQQFIFPVNIYLDFCYDYKDDFCINAIISKQSFIQKFLIFNQRGILNGIEKNFFSEITQQNIGGQQQKNENGVDENLDEKESIILMNKLYNSMNYIFMFPKLFKILNYQMMTQINKQRSIKLELLQNEILKLYFPKDLNEFIDQFLKAFSLYEMKHMKQKIGIQSNSQKSGDQSSIDSGNESEQGIGQNYIVRQQDLEKLDLNHEDIRKFCYNFFKTYKMNNNGKFYKYVCVINVWIENQLKNPKIQKVIMVEIKNLTRSKQNDAISNSSIEGDNKNQQNEDKLVHSHGVEDVNESSKNQIHDNTYNNTFNNTFNNQNNTMSFQFKDTNYNSHIQNDTNILTNMQDSCIQTFNDDNILSNLDRNMNKQQDDNQQNDDQQNNSKQANKQSNNTDSNKQSSNTNSKSKSKNNENENENKSKVLLSNDQKNNCDVSQTSDMNNNMKINENYKETLQTNLIAQVNQSSMQSSPMNSQRKHYYQQKEQEQMNKLEPVVLDDYDSDSDEDDWVDEKNDRVEEQPNIINTVSERVKQPLINQSQNDNSNNTEHRKQKQKQKMHDIFGGQLAESTILFNNNNNNSTNNNVSVTNDARNQDSKQTADLSANQKSHNLDEIYSHKMINSKQEVSNIQEQLKKNKENEDSKSKNGETYKEITMTNNSLSMKNNKNQHDEDDIFDSSLKANKKWVNQKTGIYYLKHLYQKRNKIKIVRYIGLTFLTQSMFFMSINILFVQLIYDQTIKFKEKFNLLNLLDSGVGSYQKAFMNANYNYQFNRNLMKRPTSKGLQYQLDIINKANNNLKYLLRNEPEFQSLVMNQVMSNYALILTDHNNNIRNYDLKKRQISIHQMLVQQINMYERYLNDPSYFDYERYYDLRINYQIMYIKFQQLLADTNKEINKNKVHLLLQTIVYFMIYQCSCFSSNSILPRLFLDQYLVSLL